MKLSHSSSYAVKAAVAMASQPDPGIHATSHATALSAGIPPLFLLRVLKPLVSAGILRSMKGPNGGYRLARPAKDISLLEIVEAVDGLIRGLAEADGTDLVLRGRLQAVFQQIAEQTRKLLDKVKVADLVTETASGKKK